VKAHLRRVRLIRQESDIQPETVTKDILRFDNLVLDLTRREVLLSGKPLALKPKEYDLLVFLAQHRGHALSRETILENVWGWNYVGGSRTVDVHVRWLRAKIELDPTQPSRIVTVRGAGYRFEG
jgi:DNA-binding response OmpR family regulator